MSPDEYGIRSRKNNEEGKDQRIIISATFFTYPETYYRVVEHIFYY